jgi:hypothetical protein
MYTLMVKRGRKMVEYSTSNSLKAALADAVQDAIDRHTDDYPN